MQSAEARILDRQNPIDWLHGLVAADMAATDRLIHERLGSAVPLIPDLARHLVDSGGKRLRPLLTLAAARLNGYRGAMHTRLAAAVEFIHTATLLHDDVVDVSALRRGKIAANVVWGNKSSVLVGDYLFSRAFQLMVEAGDVDVLNVLANASAVIAEGEVLQLRSANNLATTRDDYLRIITAKTAALFAAAAESGAMIANSPDVFTAAMRSFGHHLGIAFQLIDDALDYSGRQAQLGKSIGDDFREAKVTLPVIVAFERAQDSAKEFWRRTIEDGAQHEGDLKRAIAFVDETGAIEETQALARRHADQAIAALTDLPAHDIRTVLIAVAEFCVERAY
ncbi:MAG TPA: polyprenyl synthetase family protein [Rhizomicrobium sp.]|jgi:octaprenyl-diphosphate synthase|nr:polyprenyl synthetase family protein [Rhizomicrobium sp.]